MSRTLDSCRIGGPLVLAALLAGCNALPGSGPRLVDVLQEAPAPSAAAAQIVDVDATIARRLLARRQQTLFSEVLGGATTQELALIGPGDALEVTVFEAPPAVLFGGATDPSVGGARATVLPEQLVDKDGTISLPFVGRLQVSGRTTHAVEDEIIRRMRGKAHDPQVVVRFTRNPSADITVVGEVNRSLRFPVTPAGERLLDALAEAGGARQAINKTMIQVTRGGHYYALPLDLVIRDPRQNVPLRPGDVVTALYQPFSFTALGATGKNDEVSFEAQGITLAQALARSGGLVDSRSNPEGVFIFRYEDGDALDWPMTPVVKTPEGRVPVVYRIDLRNPASFFVMQSFAINDRDVLYVSNAPVAELQKFLNLVFSVTLPTASVVNAVK